MSGFDETKWNDKDFSKEFRDAADAFIPERKRHLETAVSYYKYFLQGNAGKNILDLGCGDGSLTAALMEEESAITATLTDASADMLTAAKERFSDHKGIEFINATFEDMVKEELLGDRRFDFAVSSLAIHHMSFEGKKALFSYVFDHINTGGAFYLIDVVLPPTERLEEWYLHMWTEWLKTKPAGDKGKESITFDASKKYKDNPGNTPDTLQAQLSALEEIGFTEVDCFYKSGIFTAFGGRK